MKKILGTALVIGVLAYGLNGNIFANEKEIEVSPQNESYSIERLDQSNTLENNNKYNNENRYRNGGGNDCCYDQGYNYRGDEQRNYSQNNVDSQSTSYSNF